MAEDVVELVKAANRLEEVVGELFPLSRQHGRYLRTQEHDSLVIDTRKQTYSWNSKSEQGDVIEWVMRRQGLDFKTAVEWLCRRGRLPDPRWRHEDLEARLVSRDRESAFTAAAGVFQRWLWADEAALGYVRGRGWTDETIREAGLGFSGRGSAAELEDMRGELRMRGVDPESPQGVAVLGFRGDVQEWGAVQRVEVAVNWVEWSMVPGMCGRTRLVYPHAWGGKIVTLSGRNILGAEVNREGREVKSFNLPVELGGRRQVFYNHEYTGGAETCVVVEGQADAVTLGQWGVAGVALAGTGWQDHEELLGRLRERHQAVYLGMDGDEAGQKALVGRDGDWPLARVLGPMCRVITWNS